MFPLVFVLFVAVAIAIAVLGYRAKRKRQQAMAAIARNQGLDFSVDDPFGTLAEPFTLLRRGDGRGVENVSWGVWHGVEVRAFDYWYYEETRDSNGRTSRSYSRFDCVLASVDARCPRLTIAQENILTRLADALTFRDLEFESEEFNRRFNVTGDDPRFATALCDARMMQWLLDHGDGYAFELVGDRLLCWTRRVPPAGIVHLLGTARAFREQMPDVVRSLYPNG
jgi:hypothetical protein